MNISLQPRFGLFTSVQLTQLETARTNSASQNIEEPLIRSRDPLDIDVALQAILKPDTLAEVPPSDSEIAALPEIPLARAKALAEALYDTITNCMMGPLPTAVATRYRNKLDEVVRKLHAAPLKVQQPLVDAIANRYEVAYL